MSVWPISRQAAPERGNNTGISVGPPLQGGKEGGCIHARRRLDERHLAGVNRVAPKRGQWHPHECGADSTKGISLVQLMTGSSPRVWGRPRLRPGHHPRRRFIPTRVGQTANLNRLVHAQQGSSPRVWGRLAARSAPITTCPVHPHACGADTSQTLGFYAPRATEVSTDSANPAITFPMAWPARP